MEVHLMLVLIRVGVDLMWLHDVEMLLMLLVDELRVLVLHVHLLVLLVQLVDARLVLVEQQAH